MGQRSSALREVYGISSRVAVWPCGGRGLARSEACNRKLEGLGYQRDPFLCRDFGSFFRYLTWPDSEALRCTRRENRTNRHKLERPWACIICVCTSHSRPYCAIAISQSRQSRTRFANGDDKAHAAVVGDVDAGGGIFRRNQRKRRDPVDAFELLECRPLQKILTPCGIRP